MSTLRQAAASSVAGNLGETALPAQHAQHGSAASERSKNRPSSHRERDLGSSVGGSGVRSRSTSRSLSPADRHRQHSSRHRQDTSRNDRQASHRSNRPSHGSGPKADTSRHDRDRLGRSRCVHQLVLPLALHSCKVLKVAGQQGWHFLPVTRLLVGLNGHHFCRMCKWSSCVVWH